MDQPGMRPRTSRTGRPPFVEAHAGVSERLFKVRWSNVAISLMDHGVIVAPSIVPKSIVMIENRNAFGEHLVATLLQIIRESRPDAAGYEAR